MALRTGVLVACAAASAGLALAYDNGVAKTPPMGWNCASSRPCQLPWLPLTDPPAAPLSSQRGTTSTARYPRRSSPPPQTPSSRSASRTLATSSSTPCAPFPPNHHRPLFWLVVVIGCSLVLQDDCWSELGRDNKTGRIIPAPNFGGTEAAMKNLSACPLPASPPSLLRASGFQDSLWPACEPSDARALVFGGCGSQTSRAGG